MSSWPDHVAVASARNALARLAAAAMLASALATPALAADFPGIGRAATDKEVAAWDIDVRPDFKGLPKGQGSVQQGQDVWEAQCASCHGIFGESNQVFSPLVGGTTDDDVRTGRVARLNDPAYPQRTTLMKVATVSTLWDYINRAMPWTQPKSLKPDEVYAVTAYLLNMGGILPDDFVLSDRTMAQAQARLPNRNGMSTDHALWPGARLPGDVAPRSARKPDVRATACMKDCATEERVASFVPDYARDAHGNLAEQNRLVGAQKGAETAPRTAARTATATASASPQALLQKNGCLACHALEAKVLGPSLRDVAQRHGGRADAAAYLAGKIKAGGAGVWGDIPMPAQTLSDTDARSIAQWLASGARP